MHVYPAVFLYVFPTVYLSVFLYVYPAVFLAVFFVLLHSVTVPSRLLRIRLRRRVVAAPSPRGRYGKFVARQRKAHRKIQSDLVCATEQRQPAATCTGAPSLRAEVPWQSWLAVVHEVTAEQRRPSDVEKMRSLSNRQPLMRKRSWSFLNQLHTEIQAQKINAHVYKVTETI